MKPTIAFLLSIVTRLSAAHNVALSTLSSKLAGSGIMFARLQGGSGLTLARYNAILTHCATPAHWPNGVVPADLVDQLAPWTPEAVPAQSEEMVA
jgi:hypothetical protein